MTPQPLPLVAYVDTTAVSPVAFREEPAGTAVRRRLDRFPYLLSANLLETELRAAFKAEGARFDVSTIAEINWVFPNRQLDAEMAAILEIAYLSPIRVWHLATALFFRDVLQGDLAFITLDEQQETVARDLDFRIP